VRSTEPMAEVTIHMAAAAETVWDLVSDLPRMGDWSPETARVEWIGGARGPMAGAKFRGHNQSGTKKWATTGCIAEAERGRVISWDVTTGPFAIARWAYRIAPTEDGGCDVTEQMFDHRSGLLKVLGPRVSGSSHDGDHNRTGMEATLAKLKAAAEAEPKAAAEAEPKTEAEPKAEAEPEAEPKAEADPKAEAEPKAAGS
jgi:Polyketide cyclase / dehydrase and lipid transport